jgi:hypothetical protein
MFWFSGGAALLVAIAMFWRRSTRRGPVTKEEYAPQLGTSVAAGEIAYGEEDKAEHDSWCDCSAATIRASARA